MIALRGQTRTEHDRKHAPQDENSAQAHHDDDRLRRLRHGLRGRVAVQEDEVAGQANDLGAHPVKKPQST